MSDNQNTSSIIFGFNYQIDASICIFIKNINEIIKMKVEGRFNDIELYQKDNSKIFCQVKSIYNINTKSKTYKLPEAIESLSKHIPSRNDELIFCTNQIDDLMKKYDEFKTHDILKFPFCSFSKELQKIVIKYFSKYNSNFYNYFHIMKIPYNVCDDVNSKRVFIIQEIKSLLHRLSEDISIAPSLASKWHDYFENSATSYKFYVLKEEFVWLIIASILENDLHKISVEDESMQEEVEKIYKNLILERVIDFEISNKIISLYKEQNHTIINNFVFSNKKLLEEMFGFNEIATDASLIAMEQIVIRILRNKSRIDRIKEVL